MPEAGSYLARTVVGTSLLLVVRGSRPVPLAICGSEWRKTSTTRLVGDFYPLTSLRRLSLESRQMEEIHAIGLSPTCKLVYFYNPILFKSQ